MIQKFEQFKDSLNENIDSLNESKKPVVELKKDKDRPWS
jgi:PHD/YefM family antitoxin component YafN of YafNO toxin-antitoxin module